MPLPTALASYTDCLDLYDRALATPKGTRALIGDYGDAKLFQMRMHRARVLQREEARRMYPVDDIRHGKTDCDRMTISVRADESGSWWVYVIPYGSNIQTVEDIV